MKASVSESGFTLIESIITIMIIAIAMTGLIAVWSNAVSRSADPFIQTKVSSLGEMYLAQIKAQAFADVQNAKGIATSLAGKAITGYEEFNVDINVVLAGKDFSLAKKSLKKITIEITPPQGYSQQFVTYKGQQK